MENEKAWKVKTPKTFNGAKLLGVFEDGTPEWHEARADSIGGSEIGAVCGLNQYESPYSLWAKKTGLIETEPVNNWSVRFGKAFEEPLLKLFAEQHSDYQIYKTGTYQHPDLPFMTANPDALAYCPDTDKWHIVEIKTSRAPWDEIPPSYVAQVTHYMDVLGIDSAVITGIAGWDYQEHWISYDKFAADAQRQEAIRFWQYVRDGIEPNWDGSDATYEALRKVHKDIEDVEVEIDGGHHLVLAKRAYDAAKKEYQEARNGVMASMGKARHAYVEKDGERYRVATRQARGDGAPYLVVKDK